jgi:uncharacterized Zn finger protein
MTNWSGLWRWTWPRLKASEEIFMSWGSWGEYVPVAERKRRAEAKKRKLESKGERLAPVHVSARSIATTFWGRAWCRNLEAYSDYEYRLPRGRSYVRQGAVLDLQLSPGEVRAQVMGSELYAIKVRIEPLKPEAWQRIRKACAGGIASTIELLQGRLSEAVMTVITKPGEGLFPEPSEIKLDCSCPDWADMCKHVAAVLYGVGVRLDEQPQLLFTLRGVDPVELIAEAGAAAARHAQTAGQQLEGTLGDDQLADVFGIEIAAENPAVASKPPPRSRKKRPVVKGKAGRKKITVQRKKKKAQIRRPRRRAATA